MSTTEAPNKRARDLMDRLTSLKGKLTSNATEAEEVIDAMELIRGQLRQIRPDCDEIHQGLINSAIVSSYHVAGDTFGYGPQRADLNAQ